MLAANDKERQQVPIFPILAFNEAIASDLFRLDENPYTEWPDSKPAKSVVHVEFRSLAVLEKRRMEELRQWLEDSERPYSEPRKRIRRRRRSRGWRLAHKPGGLCRTAGGTRRRRRCPGGERQRWACQIGWIGGRTGVVLRCARERVTDGDEGGR